MNLSVCVKMRFGPTACQSRTLNDLRNSFARRISDYTLILSFTLASCWIYIYFAYTWKVKFLFSKRYTLSILLLREESVSICKRVYIYIYLVPISQIIARSLSMVVTQELRFDPCASFFDITIPGRILFCTGIYTTHSTFSSALLRLLSRSQEELETLENLFI